MDAYIANVRDNQRERTSSQETLACHDATRADTEKNEPDPGMLQSIEDHQEIAKKEAAVMLVGGLRKWRRVRNLAAEYRQKPKENTRGYCGSRKRVTVAGRRNIPTVHEWHGAGRTSSKKLGPRKIVDRARNLPPPE
jgi:hypothetical protein